MTLEKLVFDVREALKITSDDSELSNRYIEYLIATYRSTFLKQELDKFGRKFNNTILQSYCVPIELISSDECSVDVNCDKIARTVSKIPTLLQMTTRDSISRVAPSNRLSKPFTLIDRNRAAFSGSSIFKTTKAFLHDDGHIYFVSPDSIYHFDNVTVTGVFEDPLELSNYFKCCDCDESDENLSYNPYLEDYPLSAHLITPVRQAIIKELSGTESLPEDTKNDTQDER